MIRFRCCALGLASAVVGAQILVSERVNLQISEVAVSLLQTQARFTKAIDPVKIAPAPSPELHLRFREARHRAEAYGASRWRSSARGLEHGETRESLRQLSLGHRDAPEVRDGIWSFHVPEPVKIVSWTGQFAMDEEVMRELTPQCTYSELPHSDADVTYIYGQKASQDWEFVISDPKTDISDADVVLFYLPYMMRVDWPNILPSKKRPGQMWIATCGEPMSNPGSGMDCSLGNNDVFMARMDGFSGFQLASIHMNVQHFPALSDLPAEALMRAPLPDFAGRGSELATYAVSDHAKEREWWMFEIIREFERAGRSDAVLSYGKSLHNAEEPSKECPESAGIWFDCWTNRCASRPFKFVAENTIEAWYVTEKLWDAFAEGSIPVYWGPHEVKQLVPPDSIIFWPDYESAAALVEALLAFTDEDIRRMRAWKDKPVSEWGNYTQARGLGHVTILPRLCEAAAKAKSK